MNDGTLEISFHSHTLVLHPEGAIWWPGERILILSDVHLGKSATFRAHGLPVPEGESEQDLERIKQLVEHFKAKQLLIAGDLLHSDTILDDDWLSELDSWFGQLPCRCLLVRGNHDPTAARLSALRHLEVTGEHSRGSLHFIHDPAHADHDSPTIAGHLHPLCRVGPKRGPKLRLPCFHLDGRLLVLPAFGTFTSGNPIAEPAATVFPIAEGRVLSACKPGS